MELTETVFPSVRHKDIVKTHQTVSLTMECIRDEYTVTGMLLSKIMSLFVFYLQASFKFQNVSVASVLCIFNVIQQFPSFFAILLRTVLCGVMIIQ
jgi:hypothetical protein